jgi:hypothetical protein
MTMKTTVVAVFCLAASLAWAEDDGDSGTEATGEVDLRVSVIENIDVTAEKAPAIDAEETDAAIDAILEVADSLEEDKEPE